MRLYNPLPMVSEEGNEEDISVLVESLFVIDSTFLTEIKDKKTKETYYLRLKICITLVRVHW